MYLGCDVCSAPALGLASDVANLLLVDAANFIEGESVRPRSTWKTSELLGFKTRCGFYRYTSVEHWEDDGEKIQFWIEYSRIHARYFAICWATIATTKAPN